MDEDIYFMVGELYVKYRRNMAIMEKVMQQNEQLNNKITELEQEKAGEENDETTVQTSN